MAPPGWCSSEHPGTCIKGGRGSMEVDGISEGGVWCAAILLLATEEGGLSADRDKCDVSMG